MKTHIQASYDYAPIQSVAALSKALSIPQEKLIELAGSANQQYRLARPIVKADGSIRQPFDALPPLKIVHGRLKDRVLAKVAFPDYLTGSLKGRSYSFNAQLHVGARILICEDVEQFFPSTRIERVFDIWKNFFGFSKEVANLLTLLTTKDGMLPQGAITSSYLANLAFWDYEPKLFSKLEEQGWRYSRYVDDIAISSTQEMNSDKQTKAIAGVYGMLRRGGYSAKRRKHEVFSANRRMVATKLIVNKRPAISSEERSRIRAAVHQLERRFDEFSKAGALGKEVASVIGRVGKLSSFHPTEGRRLKARLDLLHAKAKTQKTNSS